MRYYWYTLPSFTPLFSTVPYSSLLCWAVLLCSALLESLQYGSFSPELTVIVANADISTKGRTDTDHESNNEMNQAQRDHDPKSSSHDPSGQLLWLHVTCYERSCIVPLMGKSFLKLFGQIRRRRFGQAFPFCEKNMDPYQGKKPYRT